MRRREFIGGLGRLCGRSRRAQQGRVPRVGVLLPGTPSSFGLRANALRDGLQALGYLEGKTITFEWRWGEDKLERLPELAAELVKLNVDVIVTGGAQAARALKNATRTIPIVIAIVGDPVAVGVADSLARPGGNATGFSIISPDLSGKRVELLKEIVPSIRAVAVMSNAGNPLSNVELQQMQVAARPLNLQLYSIQISQSQTVDAAFLEVRSSPAQALIVLTDVI